MKCEHHRTPSTLATRSSVHQRPTAWVTRRRSPIARQPAYHPTRNLPVGTLPLATSPPPCRHSHLVQPPHPHILCATVTLPRGDISTLSLVTSPPLCCRAHLVQPPHPHILRAAMPCLAWSPRLLRATSCLSHRLTSVVSHRAPPTASPPMCCAPLPSHALMGPTRPHGPPAFWGCECL